MRAGELISHSMLNPVMAGSTVAFKVEASSRLPRSGGGALDAGGQWGPSGAKLSTTASPCGA